MTGPEPVSPEVAKRRAYRRQRYASDPEVRERNRAYHAANREKINAQRRDRYTLQKYGLTQSEIDALLAQQGGECAICHSTTPHKGGWHTDHDHATGRVRGVLCGYCNTGIGMLREDPDILRAAISYLSGGGT